MAPVQYETAGTILKALKEGGIRITIIGGDGWDSDKILKAAEGYKGDIYYASHFSRDDSSPETVKFKNSFKTEYKKDPDSFAVLSYDSGKIMTDALLMSSKSHKGDDIKQTLSKTEIKGVTGEIKFDDNGDSIKKAVIIKIVKGKKVYVKDINP